MKTEFLPIELWVQGLEVMNVNISALFVNQFAEKKWSKRQLNHHVLIHDLKEAMQKSDEITKCILVVVCFTVIRTPLKTMK